MSRQAERLASVEAPTDEQLTTLTADDVVPGADSGPTAPGSSSPVAARRTDAGMARSDVIRAATSSGERKTRGSAAPGVGDA